MQSSLLDERGFLSGRIPAGRSYGKGERPKIFIRTISREAASAARAADLAADSIDVGDIFSANADAIVSPANGVGHMNGGVDLRIREKFAQGGLEERVRETIVRHFGGELQVGKAFAIRTRPPAIPMRAGEPEWLVVAPTMSQPRAMGGKELKDATYVATLAALMKARDIGVLAVALTTMGAGVGAESHSARGAQVSKFGSAIAGMEQALNDFQDIADENVSYEGALAEYRQQAPGGRA